MSPIFSKLNLTNQKTICVLNPPESFQEELSQLSGIQIIDNLKSDSNLSFALIFVSQKNQIDQIVPILANKAQGDAIVWFAYPKGTSKKYQCDFNRDTGWDTLKELGFDTVRQVAIDADWSALRFRRVEFIGSR
ncbi:hypothetical protein [Solimicrobium silvestre]|uniref:DUF3052 domain-containing protein n=1 Tax=Solimicrobium silvestre TaxID=2099400 RepID=A0A2S9GUC0_9BURK|nr:hypothetical protein [Solimicrobium silvestre]PRC91256.1 hypothetical protein S2091_4041 [Solimicrobium silvestre]